MSAVVTGNAPLNEQQAYVAYLEKKYNRKLKTLDIHLDGDYADLNYEFEPVPFERIRRITGYLVGTMDQWNTAKSRRGKRPGKTFYKQRSGNLIAEKQKEMCEKSVGKNS